MTSSDPFSASFSYNLPNLAGELRGPYCVECMNRSYTSYLSHFYSDVPNEGGLLIFLHTTGGDKEYKINDLLYLNGSRRPFLFRKLPDNLVLLVRDCEYRCREAVATAVSDVPASIYLRPAPVLEASQTSGSVSDVEGSTDVPATPEASVPFTPPIARRVGKGGKQFPLSSSTASLGGTPLNKKQFIMEMKVFAGLYDQGDFSEFDKIFFTKWSMEMEPYVCCGMFIKSPTSMLQHVIKDKGHAYNLDQSRTVTRRDAHDLLRRIREVVEPFSLLKKYTSCWNISSATNEAGKRVSDPYHFPFMNGFDKKDCTDAMSSGELDTALAPMRLSLMTLTSNVSKLLPKHNAVCHYCEKQFASAGNCLQHSISPLHCNNAHLRGIVFSRSRDLVAVKKLLEDASNLNKSEKKPEQKQKPAEEIEDDDYDEYIPCPVDPVWRAYPGCVVCSAFPEVYHGQGCNLCDESSSSDEDFGTF